MDILLRVDKFQTSCLLNSFSLSFNNCSSTNKGGNAPDLIFSCASSATNITVVSFTYSLPISSKTSFHCFTSTQTKLHSTSPSSMLPPPSHLPDHDFFSSLPLKLATDTLLSTLSSSMYLLCPLSSKTKKTPCPASWLSEVLWSTQRELRAVKREVEEIATRSIKIFPPCMSWHDFCQDFMKKEPCLCLKK